VGGGGSYNPNIVNYLREQLPNTRFTLIDEIGNPIGAKEALGFALLGLEGFVGRPMIVPKNVESGKPGVVGHIQPGENMHRIRKQVCKVRRRWLLKRRSSFADEIQFWGEFPEDQIRCTTKMTILPSEPR
jgi:hypothetical protein